MKVAFFGSSLVSAYWNGAATYYRGILRELSRLGHELTFFEPDAFSRQQHRDMADPEWATVVVYPADDETGPLAALERAASADLVVKASGVGAFDALLEREVIVQRRPGQQVVFWDVDAPATLDRLERDPGDPLRALVPEFDLIFTYGGGEPIVRRYLALQARACVPVYNALDPETHHPAPAEPRFACDLGFLGNRLPDREARVHEFFFGAARIAPELRFLLGGSGWQDLAMPHNVRYLGHVYTHEHNAFNAASRVVLNVSRESMAQAGYSPATRVFEAAGAGACMVTDEWQGIERFFEPDREILVASSGEAVAARLRELDPGRARAIGAAARRRVLRDHTYRQRAALVDRTLSGRGEERAP